MRTIAPRYPSPPTAPRKTRSSSVRSASGVPWPGACSQQPAVHRQEVEALDLLALLAVGAGEAREAVARQRAAGGGVRRRDRHRRDEPLALERGQDRAPGRPGPDLDAVVVRPDADVVEGGHADDEVVAQRLRVEGVAARPAASPGDGSRAAWRKTSRSSSTLARRAHRRRGLVQARVAAQLAALGGAERGRLAVPGHRDGTAPAAGSQHQRAPAAPRPRGRGPRRGRGRARP